MRTPLKRTRPLLTTALVTALIAAQASAACTIGTPVTSGTNGYSTAQDSVQSIDVPISCAPTDQPVLTFSSAGGTYDSVSQQYNGALRAGNGDSLTYYISGAYNRVLDPLLTSFRFQVTYPKNQWQASSSSYSDVLNVTVTF